VLVEKQITFIIFIRTSKFWVKNSEPQLRIYWFL